MKDLPRGTRHNRNEEDEDEDETEHSILLVGSRLLIFRREGFAGTVPPRDGGDLF